MALCIDQKLVTDNFDELTAIDFGNKYLFVIADNGSQVFSGRALNNEDVHAQPNSPAPAFQPWRF